MKSAMFTDDTENSWIKTLFSAFNGFIYLLMGMMVAIPILFALVKEFNYTSAPDHIVMLHILLCVPGYQLLMSQAFLSLCPYNSWSTSLNYNNKRRAHWILQLLGTGLAITGSIIIMIYKEYNFDTTHGRLGLVALIFTFLSLFTGVPTLFARSLKRFIPKYVTKLVHVVLGIISFALATSCLCYGYDKYSFRSWTGDRVAAGVIAFTAIFALVMLVNPLVTMCKRIHQAVEAFRTRY